MHSDTIDTKVEFSRNYTKLTVLQGFTICVRVYLHLPKANIKSISLPDSSKGIRCTVHMRNNIPQRKILFRVRFCLM